MASNYSETLKNQICDLIDDAKGKDIQALDVRRILDITDFMVVATGTSSRHVSSVADKVADGMREKGCRVLGMEGKLQGDWVLVDFGDVIVHIMQPDVRVLYNLEKLWVDFEADSRAES